MTDDRLREKHMWDIIEILRWKIGDYCSYSISNLFRWFLRYPIPSCDTFMLYCIALVLGILHVHCARFVVSHFVCGGREVYFIVPWFVLY